MPKRKQWVDCINCEYSAVHKSPDHTPECYLLPQVDKRQAICWAGGCFSGYNLTLMKIAKDSPK